MGIARSVLTVSFCVLALGFAAVVAQAPPSASGVAETAPETVENPASPDRLPDALGEPADDGPLITNDAVIFGILVSILALVFWTHSLPNPFWVRFYKIFPLLLLCYFLPSLLTLFGVVDPATSSMSYVAKRCLLPASLVLLTLSTDLREVVKLGPKALVMFLTGTIGVMLGGPLAILIVSTFWPDLVGGSGSEAVWRGLSTVAGSWIGGGANQVAMKEIFKPSDELFSVMIAVDIFCGGDLDGLPAARNWQGGLDRRPFQSG